MARASCTSRESAEGRGLNPLLQYPEMVIHPPMLYLGYTGFTVPFAFALAALLGRYPGEKWIHITRRWTMIAWCFQSIGILLGAHWAYAVLGWGGYWAWDPVENASLLPWITGTAFLHSVMMQEKRGMMKVWNVWLVFTTFMLCILGTLLTRSGVVSSVHAFAQSSIGGWFVGFLIIVFLVCAAAYWKNRDYLRSDNQLDSLVSRESSFLFNNLILLAACFAVLWGTLFPVLSEWVEGSKISVGPPFFNKVMIPIALFLLMLTGVGPLLAWRKTSFDALKRNFAWPLGGGVLAGVDRVDFRFSRRLRADVPHPHRLRHAHDRLGVLPRRPRYLFARQHEPPHLRRRTHHAQYPSLRRLRRPLRNGPRLHRDRRHSVQSRHPKRSRHRRHPHNRPVHHPLPEFRSGRQQQLPIRRATLEVFRNGQSDMMLYPERRFFLTSQITETMVAVRILAPARSLRRLRRTAARRAASPVIHAYLNPLVKWIWFGGIVVVLGTLLALIPNRRTALVLRPVTERSWADAIADTSPAIGAVARRIEGHD